MRNNALIITILLIILGAASYIVYTEYIGITPPPVQPAPIKTDFSKETIEGIKEKDANGYTYDKEGNLQVDKSFLGKNDPFVP